MAGGADMTGFGPGTERCWLPLDLRGAGIGAEGAPLGAWLATLPCPVVAIADSRSDPALL
ncbi:MAG: hypothetical protein JWQ29_1150, partial [Phenylobacterium sp.]|nr:hypothetical protein [Phenylobacterium sp.]